MTGVIFEQEQRHLVEGSLGGADLGDDVDAVPVALDHAADPTDLALDADQALDQQVPRRSDRMGPGWRPGPIHVLLARNYGANSVPCPDGTPAGPL
jgi:hypothetical protein